MSDLLPWGSLVLVLLFWVYLAVGGCAGRETKPEPMKCQKVWNKADQRVVYECEPVSKSTLDGER
jgi:hypothetical protein